jgi:hypothetical protein
MIMNISSIVVSLSADTSGLVNAFNSAGDMTKKLEDRVKGLGTSAMALGATLSAFASGMLLFLWKAADSLSSFVLPVGLGQPLDEVTQAAGDWQEMMASLQDDWDALMRKIGPVAVELFKPIVTEITNLTDAFLKLKPETQDAIIKFAFISAIALLLVGTFLVLGGGATILVASIAAIGPELLMVGGIIGVFLIPMILLLGTVFVLWKTNWGNFRQHSSDAVIAVAGYLQSFVKYLGGWKDIIMGIFNVDVKQILKGFGEIWDGEFAMRQTYTQSFTNAIMGLFWDLLVGMVDWGLKWFDVLTTYFQKAQLVVTSLVVKMRNDVIDSFNSMASSVVDSLNRVIDSYNSFRSNPLLSSIFPQMGRISFTPVEKPSMAESYNEMYPQGASMGVLTDLANSLKAWVLAEKARQVYESAAEARAISAKNFTTDLLGASTTNSLLSGVKPASSQISTEPVLASMLSQSNASTQTIKELNVIINNPDFTSDQKMNDMIAKIDAALSNQIKSQSAYAV